MSMTIKASRVRKKGLRMEGGTRVNTYTSKHVYLSTCVRIYFLLKQLRPQQFRQFLQRVHQPWARAADEIVEAEHEEAA